MPAALVTLSDYWKFAAASIINRMTTVANTKDRAHGALERIVPKKKQKDRRPQIKR